MSARRRAVDPVQRELFRHAVAALVDEMAVALVRTARSTHLKNSMDLSAALCDPAGRLIAQGLTLPLHLGSIPDAMRAFLARFGGELRPGDVYALNDPYNGGTHLPDIYTAQPVFRNGRVIGHVVTIAHHADVGGKTAGGNGCDATELFQEGICLPPVRLMAGGEPVEHVWRLLERNVRVPNQVLGDLRAQLAAGHVGARGLLALADEHGPRRLADLGAAVLDYAADRARLAIREIPDGVYGFTDYLDDDGIDPEPIPIQVTLHVAGDRITVDFTGSGRQVRGAINCPLPFTKSAAYACVRCVMPTDIPNNEGHFRPDRGDRAGRHHRQPAPPGPGGGARTDGIPHCQRRAGRAGPGRARARAGGRGGRRHGGQPGGLRRAGRAVRAAGIPVRIVGWPPLRRRPGRGIERGRELRQQSGGSHRG